MKGLSEQPITRNNQPRMAGMERTGDNNYCWLNKLKQFHKKEGFYKPFVVLK